jgi:uncharacterized RDD family membrane protein YckC
LLSLLWVIDPLWAFSGDQKRCLHDLAAGTIVVRRTTGRGSAL